MFSFMTVNQTAGELSSERGAKAAGPSRRRGRPSRRDDILQAAEELFAKGGSRGTCIAAIADRIGVTPPAVIHHFRTKEALLREVVARIDERRSDLDLPTGDVTGPERLARFRVLGDRLENSPESANLQRLATVMVAEALDPDHPSHDYFVGRHREFRALMGENVRIGQVEGWVRADVDPDVVSIALCGAIQGIALQWFLDPDRVSLSEALDTFFAVVVDALAPRPA
jgi:AcrR family transcriptional regulator